MIPEKESLEGKNYSLKSYDTCYWKNGNRKSLKFRKFRKILSRVGSLTVAISDGAFSFTNWSEFSRTYDYKRNQQCGINELVANIMSWLIAVMFAFITNYIWVFQGRENSSKGYGKQMFSFYVGRLFTLGVEEAISSISFPSHSLHVGTFHKVSDTEV